MAATSTVSTQTEHYHFYHCYGLPSVANDDLVPKAQFTVLSGNIKDTALTQAASFDVNAGIGFISIPASASASYCEPGLMVNYRTWLCSYACLQCSMI